MITTTLSTKGQVTIPKGVRERQGWEAGLSLEVIEAADGIVLRPVRSSRATTLDEVLGCLPNHGPRKTLTDMDVAIAKGARLVGAGARIGPFDAEANESLDQRVARLASPGQIAAAATSPREPLPPVRNAPGALGRFLAGRDE